MLSLEVILEKRKIFYKKFCEEKIFTTKFTAHVGNRLKKIRLANGIKITQQDMADIIGCNRTHISAIENGHCMPSVSEFLAYSLVLKTSMDNIFPVDYDKIEKQYLQEFPSDYDPNEDKFYTFE